MLCFVVFIHCANYKALDANIRIENVKLWIYLKDYIRFKHVWPVYILLGL